MEGLTPKGGRASEVDSGGDSPHATKALPEESSDEVTSSCLPRMQRRQKSTWGCAR
jgi:hypothetical protein